MKKCIVVAIFFLFFSNQNSCKTDYINLINTASNKIVGALCLVPSGIFSVKAYWQYECAWKQHKRIVKRKDDQKNPPRHNAFYAKSRNKYLLRGTLHLTLAGLFAYSTYRYWFKC